MKSKAHIKGHPIHPILVSFPIAFFIGAFIFEVMAWNYRDDDFRTTAGFLILAGIGFALLAAIPGIIDFLFTVPPDSSGKKRAARHGLTNISVIILFACAYFMRIRETSPILIIGLESTAIILLGIAGWMGGTLVYRNQIGVNPRYAGAGKWKEEYIRETKNGIEVAGVNELETDQMKLVHINGKRIVVARTEKGWVAFDDHTPGWFTCRGRTHLRHGSMPLARFAIRCAQR